jgi:hypothetical protein
MDKTALVSLDIQRGREVVEALDGAKVKIAVALWAYSPEYEDWRLVISGRQLDSLDLQDAYRRVNDSLTSAGVTPDKTPPILILSMNDSFIRTLRQNFAKAKSVEGMRLGGQMIGDRFLEDAYVYKIS